MEGKEGRKGESEELGPLLRERSRKNGIASTQTGPWGSGYPPTSAEEKEKERKGGEKKRGNIPRATTLDP